MPGLAHLVTGITFALLLHNTDPKRFTRKHALIFAFMSYLGPDFAHIMSFGSEAIHRLGHSILGWPFYALFLLPFYTFLTRFSFDIKTLQLYDEGPNSKSRLPWWRVYLLMLAGGLFHFSVDITFERKRVWPFPLDDPYMINIEQLKENLYFTRSYSETIIMVISIILIVSMFILFNEFMKRADKEGNLIKLNILIALFVVAFIILYSLMGMTGEADLGAITYFTVFFFGPVVLSLFSFFPENYSPPERDYNENKARFKLNIGIFYLMGAAFLVVGIYAAFSKQGLLALIDDDDTQEIINGIYWFLVVLVLILSIFHGGVGYLLMKRKMLGQRFAPFLLILGFLIMVPLVIWGLLREKEVVALFQNKKEAKISPA